MFDITGITTPISTFATAKNSKSIDSIISSALSGYSSESKPKIEKYNDGREIRLKGGSYSARQDIEDELRNAGMLDGVNNSPTGKIIYIK